MKYRGENVWITFYLTFIKFVLSIIINNDKRLLFDSFHILVKKTKRMRNSGWSIEYNKMNRVQYEEQSSIPVKFWQIVSEKKSLSIR